MHGPVFATATVNGKPYALSRERSTFGRDALNLAALHDMTDGRAQTPKKFWKTANNFGFTFNWAYVSHKKTAYFTSGRLPVRARHLDRRLPTLGTGHYEWKGYLKRNQHPHAVGGPHGLLLNWNNRSAPGFMHGDDEPYGSVQHVELFNQWPKRAKITDNVGIMNRAASEDGRAPVWPYVSAVLRKGTAPNARDQHVVDLLDNWVKRAAPRLDANEDGTFDEAGPTIMDQLWRPIAEAVMGGRLSNQLVEDVNDVRSLGSFSGESYVDKDLRTLLGRKVKGKFNLRYCGRGSMAKCSSALWAAVDAAPPRSNPSSAARTRRPGGETPTGPASFPACCRPRSRARTGRPSSRCSSSCTGRGRRAGGRSRVDDCADRRGRLARVRATAAPGVALRPGVRSGRDREPRPCSGRGRGRADQRPRQPHAAPADGLREAVAVGRPAGRADRRA